MRIRQSARPVLAAMTMSALLGLTSAIAANAAPSPPRPESQQEFWARYDQRDWSAAIDEARHLVEPARANASDPMQLANALTLLGNAQLSSGDRANAEGSYREALQITEAQGAGAGPAAVDPLRGLGYSLALLERHDEAVPYMERALIIIRRSFGLFDPSQQSLLRQLATSLTRTGRAVDAQKQMLYLQRVGERTYGESDPRMAQVLCVVGDWYVDLGSFLLGRERYRDALEIVEKKLGKNDPALVLPLRSLARSYLQEVYFIAQGYQPMDMRNQMDATSLEPKGINPKYISTDGERALQRAMAILDAHTDTPPALLTDTLIQFGDWYQVKHQPEKALTYYRRAAAMVANGAKFAVEEPMAPLSFPVRVYYPLPPLAMRNRQLSPAETEEKVVSVQFTVTGSGEVQDAKVIEQNGSQRQASEALEAVRSARYRPKFVNGEPVETQGVVNREVFRIRKQDDDDSKS